MKYILLIPFLLFSVVALGIESTDSSDPVSPLSPKDPPIKASDTKPSLNPMSKKRNPPQGMMNPGATGTTVEADAVVLKPVPTAPSPVDPNSDAPVHNVHRREGKTATAGVQAFGMGPNLSFTHGLFLGMYLNEKMLIFLEGTNGSEPLTLFSDVDMESSSYGLHFKHYVGDSFYYRVGVDYRKMEFANDDLLVASDYRAFDAKSVAVTLAIGHQWQWEYFTMGVDWIGVSAPISYDFTNEHMNGGATQKDMDDDKDDYVRRPNINLVRFYLGASF